MLRYQRQQVSAPIDPSPQLDGLYDLLHARYNDGIFEADAIDHISIGGTCEFQAPFSMRRSGATFAEGIQL